MSRKTTFDLPLGEHVVKCTIEVPIGATASSQHSRIITTMTDEITAAVRRATNLAAQQPGAITRPTKRQHRESSADEEELPVLHPDAETSTPNDEGSVRITLKDLLGNEYRCTLLCERVLATVTEAYATLRGMHASTCRFIYKGKTLEGHETAASLKLEDGDTIYVVLTLTGS
ncbi:SUMO protein smt3 [Elasticomyces elasticus]|nr:SUMO protein smt3 [Elasticomyces elasticus]KAK3661840.1 SUMO protein smt3 [Elasticomyces elasticus]KAK4924444.1 SUMO protein smt3 [Elasticomyces elasticus]KAK5762591.1 SUMO protein smt3 [Elasticomyces elasticus]